MTMIGTFQPNIHLTEEGGQEWSGQGVGGHQGPTLQVSPSPSCSPRSTGGPNSEQIHTGEFLE